MDNCVILLKYCQIIVIYYTCTLLRSNTQIGVVFIGCDAIMDNLTNYDDSGDEEPKIPCSEVSILWSI